MLSLQESSSCFDAILDLNHKLVQFDHSFTKNASDFQPEINEKGMWNVANVSLFTQVTHLVDEQNPAK